jgi:hypothetical protein
MKQSPRRRNARSVTFVRRLPRRAGASTAAPKRSIFPPYPDLGMHVWDTLPLPMRSVEMVLINCRPQALISGPEGGWDVQFHLDTVDGRFLGTLHTKQSRDEIRAIMERSPDRFVVVAGRLSDAVDTGTRAVSDQVDT